MNFSSIPILATAIAIVISWALFAMFCSLIHEGIAQIKAERGRFMKKYLFAQLQDLPNGVNWASLLYQHGTIDLLSRAPEKPTNEITPPLFAETLVEVVGSAQIVSVKTAPQHARGPAAALNVYKNPVLSQFKTSTQVLTPSAVLSFFSQAIASAESKTPANPYGTANEAEIYRQLLENIKNWYDEFTARLTLW